MKIVAVKEANEKRVALVPKIIEKLKRLNFDVAVEKDIGKDIFLSDEMYKKAGAAIEGKDALLTSCDILLKVRAPNTDEISKLKQDSITISFLDPFTEKNIIDALIKKNITSISMHLLPRSTIAQKMDALSSQANLAGYASVILAAKHFHNILPMMTTPAGTISPAKFFIIGAGVAGLQAIATARRLGAKVEAFDTRAAVEEQVKSLGAKFVKIDLGKTESTKEGYAKELSQEQIQKQRDEMKKICTSSDVIITTAQVFGKKAPVIITQEMLKDMQPGSIVIDMAASTGGNVEGSKVDEVVNINNITILGPSNLLTDVASNASFMYSSNLYNLIEHFFDKEQQKINLNFDDEIIKKAMVTNKGQIISSFLK